LRDCRASVLFLSRPRRDTLPGMTAAEWRKCTNFSVMTGVLNLERNHLIRGRRANRRLRLFACACCRHIWDRLPTDDARRAVLTAERHADGQAEKGELLAARAALSWLDRPTGPWKPHTEARAARATVAREAWLGAQEAALGTIPEKVSCALLRDIFGNPFRPPPRLEPAWLAWNGGTVRRLARSAYEDRDLPAGTLNPSCLAVLADALEEAGCDDRDLLRHLRSRGPHVRGCWAVDLLLGKG
jgi:hypothetical protein